MRTPKLKKDPAARRTKTPEQALAALMRLCARAEKSEGDARRLLRGWGVNEGEAEQIVTRLTSERFIDDARYAGAFVREKMRLSGWGEYKIRAALQRKGIARATIDEALGAADRTGMEERLRTQLLRKLRQTRYATQYELKTKLIRYGLSLGYDYETVHETAASLAADTEPCDEF
ncbi:MAG: RecX family transcriptional regulator [Alistipes sp.]|nr:RecX family transcriptional regulator [Alistipes sp.]